MTVKMKGTQGKEGTCITCALWRVIPANRTIRFEDLIRDEEGHNCRTYSLLFRRGKVPWLKAEASVIIVMGLAFHVAQPAVFLNRSFLWNEPRITTVPIRQGHEEFFAASNLYPCLLRWPRSLCY